MKLRSSVWRLKPYYLLCLLQAARCIKVRPRRSDRRSTETAAYLSILKVLSCGLFQGAALRLAAS